MKNLNKNIVDAPINTLKPYSNNARTHSPKQIKQIADSIKTFGFNNPVLIDKHNTIIAGHGRVLAAQELKLNTVPTLCLDHLTEAQKKAYILADNRIAEQAGWDKDILAIELQNLIVGELDFDVTITGFSMPEIDILLDVEAPDADDDLPEENVSSKPVTQLGDVWQLGKHRILCGDALQIESYQKLMGEEKAQMIFTDPPYNVPVQGHICGNGKVKHEEFAMASGEMSQSQFTQFLQQNFTLLAEYSLDGAIHFICMDWRHMGELLSAGHAIYSELKNVCVWNKNNGGMGSLYRSKHEMVFVFKHGKAAHINNVELGSHGRYRTNVWDYAGVCGKTDELAMHPTVKPVAMIADALLDCSHRGDIILDAFGGSGSTLIAAERVGRKARLLELNPKYVDVTIRRWQERTGEDAIHIPSGRTFTQREGGRNDE